MAGSLSRDAGSKPAAQDRRLSGKALTALGATTGQHLLAALGGHAGAETMAALTDEPARLEGPLGAHDASRSLGCKTKGRALPQPPASVKAHTGRNARIATIAMAAIH